MEAQIVAGFGGERDAAFARALERVFLREVAVAGIVGLGERLGEERGGGGGSAEAAEGDGGGGALARRAGAEGVGEGFEGETGVLETRQAVRGGAQGEFAERFLDGEGEDGGGG